MRKALFIVLLLALPASAATINLSFEATAIQVKAAQEMTRRANLEVTAYNDSIIANQARIDARNVEITAENIERAAMDPPLDPLPLLEDDPRTPRDAYTPQTYMVKHILERCDRWARDLGKEAMANKNIQALWRDADDATRDAVRQLLIDGA